MSISLPVSWKHTTIKWYKACSYPNEYIEDIFDSSKLLF